MIETESSADPREQRWNSLYEEAAEEDEIPLEEDKPNLWQIGAGTMVMIAGVILPVFAITIASMFSFEGIWRLLLLHPLETLIEAGLVLTVPFGNFNAWNSLCHKDFRHPVRTGILNGIAIAVPLCTLAIAAAAFALNYPLIDSVNGQTHALSMSLMALASLPAIGIAIYLAHLLRQAKHTRISKLNTVLYSLLGIVLTLLSLCGAEARSTYIRVMENMALSDEAKDHESGLAGLRAAQPEKELKMTCADPHCAGLAGMFLPLNSDAQKRLYFAATGKPYRDSQSTNMSLMSNEYLRNHVVGEPIDGLSLHRSAILGSVHPQTLSSTLNWTFVFKNKSYSNQEARAEIALPEGAVISDLTLWINGQARSGAFSATEQAAGAYNWITVQHRDPALITDLGRGRYLLQCSPVPGQGEMKVQVSITEPLKLDGANNASFGMPRFIDSNFALNGQHAISLRSSEKLSSGLPSVKSSVTSDGASLLSGSLKQADISNSAFTVKVDKSVQFKSVVVKDPFRKDNAIVFEQLKTRSAQAPRHLVVVVDSSQAMKSHVNEVIKTLQNIPDQVKTEVMLAGDKESDMAFSKEEAIEKLRNNQFGGGQDNLFAVVKAAEKAGESKGGAVIWIHGAQPGYNNEMYIMTPYAATPSFYEVALDDCLTDTNEFFKNHKDVGPFAAIARSGPLADDLTAFLSKWQPNAMETYVDLGSTPSGEFELSTDKDASREISVLAAAQNVKQLLASGQTAQAAALGVKYHIVTPVSGAVVLENASDYRRFGMEVPNGTPEQSQVGIASAPMLQGATNGTLGPQGSDATMISGINTTGTVRVNNLANLEALINICANGLELVGMIWGGISLVMGAMGKGMISPFKLSAKGRMAFGVTIVLLGLAAPGMFNWLLASARDANLFS